MDKGDFFLVQKNKVIKKERYQVYNFNNKVGLLRRDNKATKLSA